MIEMIDELLHSSTLKKNLDIIRDKNSSEQQVIKSKENIEKAKKIVPRLRQWIKVKSSIFEYSG